MTREKLGTDNVYSFPITQQTQIDRNRAVDFRKNSWSAAYFYKFEE